MSHEEELVLVITASDVDTDPYSKLPEGWHQCVCRIVASDNVKYRFDRCPGVVKNPDQPFCDQCEADDHREYPEQDPVMPGAVGDR